MSRPFKIESAQSEEELKKRRCIVAGCFIVKEKIFARSRSLTKQIKMNCPKCSSNKMRKNGHRRGQLDELQTFIGKKASA
jgi:hypothetical protein